MSKQPLYIYYVTVRHDDHRQHTYKVKAKSKRGAVIKACQQYEHNEVSSVNCTDGVPYTAAAKAAMLANKRRAKERAKLKAEADIMKYDGLNCIDVDHDKE